MPSVADQSVRSGVQGAPTFPVGAGVVGVPGTIFGVGLVAGRGAVWVGGTSEPRTASREQPVRARLRSAMVTLKVAAVRVVVFTAP